ncbi:MAG: J domain-containing protein, partial [Bdellovibrionales bacterium]|nr:J domain-containing protein [Bdellovibrionales bacterium]
MLEEQVGANYYRLLGVSRDATFQEIDEAYRSLIAAAQKLRRTEELSRQLRDAHETLSDPDRRAHYDQSLPSGIYYWEATQAFTWTQDELDELAKSTQHDLPAHDTRQFDSTRATVDELEQLAPIGYEGNLRESLEHQIQVPHGAVEAAGMSSMYELRPVNHYLSTRRAMPVTPTQHFYHDKYNIDLTRQSVLDIRSSKDMWVDRLLLGVAI